MAAQGAKDVLIRPYVSGSPVTLAGVRTRNISLNNELVDVTNSDSPGRWKELLTGVGVRSIQISGQGVFQNQSLDRTVLNTVLAGGSLQTDVVIPNMGTFTGTFVYTQCKYSGEHNKEIVYDITIDSSGSITFT